MKKLLVFSTSFLAASMAAQQADPGALKARAYELYSAKRFDEAATQFQTYLDQAPGDARALFDYAALLIQLNRHEDAARQLERLHRSFPAHEAGYFQLGVTYIALGQTADAAKVFAELQASANPEMATAARRAAAKLQEDQARAVRQRAESHIFELARSGDHAQVVAEVNTLAAAGEISYALELQRIYALSALHQYPEALAHAQRLTPANPTAVDLALERADLLAQLGRRPEAEAIWRRVAQQHPGTSSAVEATRRLQEQTLPPPEDEVYDLVRRQQHRQAVAAIDEMEQKGPLSWAMAMQRIYSLQALGEKDQALAKTGELARQHPEASDLGLLRADQLIAQREWMSAAKVLSQIKRDQPDSPEAKSASERLEALPPMANVDKWYWGEAYSAGDYLGRYGTLVGSGFIRQGMFVPEARWLQPYLEFRYSVDTGSGTGPRETVIEDNSVGLYGGARIQLFPTEYLFLYGQGGGNQDLLGRRHDGDWATDYQAGIFGFKSWGPGVVFWPDKNAAQVGSRPEAAQVPSGWVWRGDWFVDVGANFSYYHRYESAIGYGQTHQGFRLGQFGPQVAWDAYLIENVTWDVKGNYFDNYFDFGPGTRLLWQPNPRWHVQLNVDQLHGYYFGRHDNGSGNGADTQYNGVHVTLSVGANW
ncbi:MAG TPA: tetratricopeptide repeat protein [Candidatus Saccharimonadales bacterium]|nr:tetratricopeptide repeat protein [Candidatus Saccharimonadales bacterium]